MTEQSSKSGAWRYWIFAVSLLTATAGGIAVVHFAGHREPVAPALIVAAMPLSGDDWIGFHGAGRLLGEAPAIKAPPMRVRWKFQTADDDTPLIDLVPAPPPHVAATGPSTHPATLAAVAVDPSSGHLAPAVDGRSVSPATSPSTKPAATQPVPAPPSQANLTPGHFEGSAAIVGGRAYVGDTSGVLRAIDIATGKVIWAALAADGFETTPLVIDGRIFIGDLGGMFYALSADTGKKIWNFDTSAEIHCSANYLGDDRKRIVFGTDGADVFCMDTETGKVIWNKKAQAQVYGTPGISAGSVLVSGCDAQLRAMKGTDGEEDYAIDLGAPCAGSAAVVGDSLVLGTDQGRVMSLSGKTHKQNWLFSDVGQSAWVFSSPAVADGIVVFGARDNNVYGLGLATGKQLWTFATRGEVDSSPVISGGRVYFGSKDKKFYVLDLKTGKELWSFKAGRGIDGSPAVGNGVVIVGDTGGNLFCLE